MPNRYEKNAKIYQNLRHRLNPKTSEQLAQTISH